PWAQRPTSGSPGTRPPSRRRPRLPPRPRPPPPRGRRGRREGTARTLLPRGGASTTVSLVSGAAWRLEMHAPTQATTQDWLTVVSAGNTVPDQTRLSSEDGNVVTGSVVGVHVRSSPRNAVVLFGADHAATATTSEATYVVAQTADADHMIFDMSPSATGYAATTTASNGKLTVVVTQGGPLALTAQGTLSFTVKANGTVAAPATAPTTPDSGSPMTVPASQDGGAPSTPNSTPLNGGTPTNGGTSANGGC